MLRAEMACQPTSRSLQQEEKHVYTQRLYESRGKRLQKLLHCARKREARAQQGGSLVALRAPA